MEMYAITVGPIQENCYFLIGDHENDTIIFDPGEQAEDIIAAIEENALHPIAIVLTHAHYDHIGALETIREKYDVPVYQNPIEREWLLDPQLNGSARNPNVPDVRLAKEADVFVEEMGPYEIGEFRFEMQHIPGHSPGSTVFIFRENGFAIVGDVIFKGSVGRSDLPGGSHETLIEGIQKYIVTLPGETVLFPGHGDPTTVREEIYSNPYLNGATR